MCDAGAAVKLVVSPHHDDAVLSCGQLLAAEECAVVTVFGGTPANGEMLTDYDSSCGFSSAAQAMRSRALETTEAMGVLGVTKHLALAMTDIQYGEQRRPVHRVAEQLAHVMAITEADGIVGPLGLQHPDHVLVTDACLLLAEQGHAVWLASELPTRVVWPELEPARLAVLPARWTPQPDDLGTGDRSLKERAIACYVSQPIDLPLCLAPERYWRLCGPEEQA